MTTKSTQLALCVSAIGVGYGTGPGQGILECGWCHRTFPLGDPHVCPRAPRSSGSGWPEVGTTRSEPASECDCKPGTIASRCPVHGWLKPGVEPV